MSCTSPLTVAITILPFGRWSPASAFSACRKGSRCATACFITRADLTGVDDRHRETGFDRVVQERGVDRFAHRVIAAKRERNVGKTAAHARVRQVLAYPACRLDEVAAVVVVFLYARRNGENVRVE